MNPLLSATLIYDGHSAPVVPAQLLPSVPPNPDHTYTPEEHRDAALALIGSKGQLHGTHFDVLCEIAGRACYDSFGKGRASVPYHIHLVEVNHGSVWEHANFSVVFTFPASEQVEVLSSLLNRPGVYVTAVDVGSIELTLNLRAAREWDLFGEFSDSDAARYLRAVVVHWAYQRAPQVMQGTPMGVLPDPMYSARPVDHPTHPEARWVTLLLTGSRGFSHELVRHKYRTAVSQRSTRYVDEDGSPYVVHPVVAKYLLEDLRTSEMAKAESQHAYRILVTHLEAKLVEAGVDKVTARKQARGAARGYLGNALYTEVVFSASVAQWRRMLKQRANPAADAEIREVFCKALPELQRSQHGPDFLDITLAPSPDGIGQVAEFAGVQ